MTFHSDSVFSLTVNFHAIGEYFNQQGGLVFHQPSNSTMRTSAFILGSTNEQLSDLLVSIDDHLCQCSPADYFSTYQFSKQSDFDMDNCLAQMHLSRWDPYVLFIFSNHLEKHLKEANWRVKQGFIEGMTQASENIYPMPKMKDYYYIIAMIYHLGKYHQQAISFYYQSLALQLNTQSNMDYQQLFYIYLNLGLCHYVTGYHKKALSHMKNAEKIIPDDKVVAHWIKN